MKLNKTIIFNYIGEKLLKLHNFIENKINSIVLYKKNDLKTSKRKIIILGLLSLLNNKDINQKIMLLNITKIADFFLSPYIIKFFSNSKAMLYISYLLCNYRIFKKPFIKISLKKSYKYYKLIKPLKPLNSINYIDYNKKILYHYFNEMPIKNKNKLKIALIFNTTNTINIYQHNYEIISSFLTLSKAAYNSNDIIALKTYLNDLFYYFEANNYEFLKLSNLLLYYITNKWPKSYKYKQFNKKLIILLFNYYNYIKHYIPPSSYKIDDFNIMDHLNININFIPNKIVLYNNNMSENRHLFIRLVIFFINKKNINKKKHKYSKY